MNPRVQWILVNTKKWHAWPTGGRATLCGRVNIEHLRVAPAREIRSEISPAEDICRACSKGLGGLPGAQRSIVTEGLRNNPDAAAWFGVLKRNLVHRHIQASDKVLRTLADRLSEIGPPTSPDARAVYTDVSPLLLSPVVIRTPGSRLPGGRRSIQTIPHLQDALSQMTAGARHLEKVQQALQAWKLVTGGDITIERCRIDRVVAAMLQIPNPRPYVQHLYSRGLKNLAVLFHQNTLDRAKSDPALRGLFTGSSEYWTGTTAQLHIISE